jgi:hypothetical protein
MLRNVDATGLSTRMSESGRLAPVMFWLMVLLGGSVLAPCLILPAWLEYQASLDLRALRKEQVERRRAEVARLRKQREHLETDDAYLLRVARENLNIEIPGVQQIHVEPSPLAEPATTEPAAAAAQGDELVPELSAMIEQVMQRYPLTQVFVHPATRPPLMLIGGGLIVTALVLLSAPAPRPRPPAAKPAGPRPRTDKDGYLADSR